MPIDPSIYFNHVAPQPGAQFYANQYLQGQGQAIQNQQGQMQIDQMQAQQARQQAVQGLAQKYQTPQGFDQRGFINEYAGIDPLGAQAMHQKMTQEDATTQKIRNEAQEAYLKMDTAMRTKATQEAQEMAKATDYIKEAQTPQEQAARWDQVAKSAGLPHMVGQFNPQTLDLINIHANVWKDMVAEKKAAEEAKRPEGFHPAIGPDGKPGIFQTTKSGEVKQIPGIKPVPSQATIFNAQMGGKFDPSQPLPDVGMEAVAQAIARKEQPPQEYSVRNPAGRIINARAAMIGEGEIMGKGAQATRQAGLKDFEPSGTSGKTISALNTMTEHLATARRLADALKSGNTPVINKLSQSLGIQMGSNNATNFQTLKQFLSGEVAKVATGGHITEGEIHAAAARLNEAGSPEQLIGSLDVMREIAGGKLIALDQDYRRLSGKGLVEGGRLTPATVEAFKGVSGAHGSTTKALPESMKGAMPPAVLSAYMAGKPVKGPDGTIYQKGM